MEGFILKIFFSGLIAFVPSPNGKELTVLLVNTPHQYALEGGATLPHHRAILVARAASCNGACVTPAHPSIARFLFANKTDVQAANLLNGAILGGGAWELSGVDLTLAGPREPLAIHRGARSPSGDRPLHSVPATKDEREDFAWLPSITAIAPSSGGLKSGLVSGTPPEGLIAARLKLRSGKVFTYSVIRVDAQARPIHFRTPSGDGPEAPVTQALANWVEAEIHIPAKMVEIDEQSLSDPDRKRSMKLTPQEGVVEIALLDLPPFVPPSEDAARPEPAPGQHFQVFYDLLNKPPAPAMRMVPQLAADPLPSDPEADWESMHPPLASWPNLLRTLKLTPFGDRGPYDLTLCPMIRE